MDRTWGERLKAVRTRMGLSQSELARQTSISRFSIGKVESGRVRVPYRRLREWIESAELPVLGAEATRIFVRSHAGYVECVVAHQRGEYLTACGIGVGRNVGLAYWTASRDAQRQLQEGTCAK